VAQAPVRKRPSQIQDRYRPVSRRRRALTFLLGAATAITIVLMLLDPPGGVQRTRPVPAGPALCTEGQLSGCIGGKADVIHAPPHAASGAGLQR